MKFKKSLIFICLIICLFSVASVCASNVNETVAVSESQSDELLNIENQDVNDVNVAESEILTASSDDEVIATDDSSDILTVENNNESIACDDSSDVLTMENNNETLAVTIPSTTTVQSYTDYKTFSLGKLKLPKKYLKFENNYKPSKKNKKLWKQYKAYKKYSKKATKKFNKKMKKIVTNALKNHWHFYGGAYYLESRSGKNIVYSFYYKAYRRYNYNWITCEEWWD